MSATTDRTLKAFLNVQAELAQIGISKDSRNKQQNYQYRGIDALMNTLAPILAKHGVVILTNVTDSEYVERRTANGGLMYHHKVKVEFTIASEHGTVGPFSSHGECLDTSDKGTNKAIGAAYKYWLFTSLCVPTDAHSDADAEQPEAVAPKQERPQQEQVKRVGEGEVKQIRAMLEKTDTDEAMYVNFLQLERLEDLPLIQFSKTMEQLSRKLKKMEREAQRSQSTQAATEEAQQ